MTNRHGSSAAVTDTLRHAGTSRGQLRKSPFDSRLTRLQRAPGLSAGGSAEMIMADCAEGVTGAPGAPRERAAERLIHPRTVDRGSCRRRLIVRAPTPEADAVSRPDHLDPVEPAQQGPVGQHDVRAPAFPAARSPRAKAQVAGPITDPAAPRVTPGAEHALADGAP